MMKFSDFDKSIKLLILKSDFESSLDLLTDFYAQLNGSDELAIFDSLLKYYRKNSVFSALSEKRFARFKIELPLNNHNGENFNLSRYPDSKLLIIRPDSVKNSAGVGVFQSLLQVIRRLGFVIDELVYRTQTDLDYLFLNSRMDYELVIIPETISYIPNLQTKNIMIYHGNRIGKLPQIRLGSRVVDPVNSINYVHSHSIDNSMTRLFLNTFDFERFKPTQKNRRGGTAIYLGKAEKDINSASKLAFFSEKFDSNLVLTRNFPDSEILPSYARQLELLITLDPISSINIEFASAGCPVLFVNFLDYFGRENIVNHELMNENFRFDQKEIGMLDYSDQIANYEQIFHSANEMQKSDIDNFINHLNRLVGKSSLPS
jgi:hypothetical protein